MEHLDSSTHPYESKNTIMIQKSGGSTSLMTHLDFLVVTMSQGDETGNVKEKAVMAWATPTLLTRSLTGVLRG